MKKLDQTEIRTFYFDDFLKTGFRKRYRDQNLEVNFFVSNY